MLGKGNTLTAPILERSDTGLAYVRLTSIPVSRSEEIGDLLVLDLDVMGRVVGVEFVFDTKPYSDGTLVKLAKAYAALPRRQRRP